METGVAAFNKANRWRKRGCAMTPVKYGASDSGFMSGAIVNVIAEDGSVSVSTTGCEIGQGLYTKVAQAVAYKFGISIDTVTVLPTETAKMANFGDTGGSATSECSVQAALYACDELLKRLLPFRKPGPHGKEPAWGDVILACSHAGYSLTSYGYFNGDKTGNNKGLPPPPPASAGALSQFHTYFVYAAAVTEVELDVLTGEITVLSMDVVYDSGVSLNPKIDLGQIEGGIVMSMGWYLTEEIVQDPSTGRMLSNGTRDYHPPQSKDIPVELNVHMLHLPNPAGACGYNRTCAHHICRLISVMHGLTCTCCTSPTRQAS